MKKYLIYFLALTAFPLLFISCKKDKGGESLSGKTEVVFVVGGTEDGIELKASKANLVQLENNNIIPNSTTKLKNGFEFETYASQDSMQSISNSNSMIRSGLVNPVIQANRASTTPMETNKKFRILMRRLSGGPWITNANVKVGSELSVEVDLNEQYEYIAYSYNDEQDIPDPLQNGGGLTLQTPKDRDLLWAKNIISITTEGTTREAIHFYHKVALVSLNLDFSLFAGMVESLHAELTDITYNSANSSKNGNFYTSTLNLETGELSNHVAYTPPSEVFTGVDPAFPAKRNDVYYTSNAEGLESFRISLSEFNVSGIDQVSEGSPLNFDYSFIPSAGRPPVKEGHRLTANLLLMKTLPQMYVLSGDTLNSSARFSASSYHLLTRTRAPEAGNILGYIGRVTGYLGEIDSYKWAYRDTYPSASGYIRTNFARINTGDPNTTTAKRLYYTPGKIKVEGDVISDLFETQGTDGLNPIRGTAYTLAAQLQPDRRRPDVIILSHSNVNLNQADNDALIKYVKEENGIVLILADRSRKRYNTRPTQNSDATSMRFIRSIFGSGVDDLSIGLGRSSSSNTERTDVGYNSAFKLKNNLPQNDPIMNGFYGNLGGTYWSSTGDFSYITGINENNIINYSDIIPTVKNDGGNNLPIPSSAKIMFRHKTYNVFWIGDGELLTGNGYVTSTSNDSWKYPITSTTVPGVSGYPVNNSKIFGNFLVWAFVQKTLSRP